MFKIKGIALAAIGFSLLGTACRSENQADKKDRAAPGTPSPDSLLSVVSPSIEAFRDQAEMDAYFTRIFVELKAQREAQENSLGKASNEDGSMAPEADSASESTTSAPSNETITNNQEAGVDEGGIVKNIGDSLVILRRGRLYVAKTEASGPVQTDSLDVARESNLLDSVWYDELLVKGDLIYVVGYRYGQGSTGFEGESMPADSAKLCAPSYYGATEINSFRLSGGKLSRLETRFFESSDYFSGSNYTSRLVNGKLVFYMPYHAYDYCYQKQSYSVHIPQELKYEPLRQGFSPVKPVFQAINVFKNIERLRSPIFHTILSCELPSDGSLACNGQAILGEWVEERYVSPNAVYLFAQDRVYSLGLKDLSMKAHARDPAGQVINQFSFKESPDALMVLTSQYPRWDYETDRQVGEGGVDLYSFPLAAFDQVGQQKLDGLSVRLAGDSSYGIQQRFMGNNLLLALQDGPKTKLMSYDFVAKTRKILDIAGQVSRIETLDANLAFVSSNSSSADPRGSSSVLSFSTVRLDQEDLEIQTLSANNTFESENRSHAFSQKKLADGTYLFGIPTMKEWSSFGGGGSSLNFFLVNADASLKSLGHTDSIAGASSCQSSCVDWYGNTRPIFLGERIFGLMGDELVELSLGPDALSERSPRLRMNEAQAR